LIKITIKVRRPEPSGFSRELRQLKDTFAREKNLVE
jgi:hypothetical protein